MNAVERIGEWMDLEEEAPAHIPEKVPRPSWPEQGSIKVRDLVVKYAPDTPAVLHNISFEVKPREKIAIVGKVWCKSTKGCVTRPH